MSRKDARLPADAPAGSPRPASGPRVPHVLLVYNSVYGNTRSIAEAISAGLSGGARVEIVGVHGRLDVDRRGLDLLVVGGPTHHGGMAERLELFLSRIARHSLDGLQAATFDTRYRGPALVRGSAARDARKRLRKAGCRVEVPPESFFVERDHPPKGKRRHDRERLEAGELERARAWGAHLLSRLPFEDHAAA